MTDLTAKDCQVIVANCLGHNDFLLIDFHFEPFCSLQGFHGSHGLLKVNISQQKKPKEFSFFVKSACKTGKVFERYLSQNRCFYKEHVMMFKVLKDFHKYTGMKLAPACYLSKVDDVVVQENLMLSGYDVKKGEFDLVHATAAIETFADFHAASFIAEAKSGEPLTDTYGDVIFETFFARSGELTYGVMKEFSILLDKYYKDYSNKKRMEIVEFVTNTVFNYTEPSKRYRNIFCHGDPWGNNILFRYKDGQIDKCVLVDFQASRFVPPAFEVMEFLHVGLPSSLRKQNKQSLIDRYYARMEKTLSKYGLDVSVELPHDQFIESCREYEKCAVSIHVIYTIVTQLPKSFLAIAAASEDDFLGLLIDGDPRLPIKAFEENSDYRKMLTETLDDVLEVMEIEKNVKM